MPDTAHPQAPEQRPTPGTVEQRTAPVADTLQVDGPRLRGRIPYSVESRDMGGWREIIEPGALRGAKLDDLVATVDHVGLPIGRHPRTLELEDRGDALHWSVELPESRADVREAVQRGDLRAGSWRMVVGRDEWRGDVRHVHEITELKDVAVVVDPAYPDAHTEWRARPETTSQNPSAPADTTGPQGPEQEGTVPENRQSGESRQNGENGGPAVEDRTAENSEQRSGGGLQIEDRSAEAPNVEARIEQAIRSVRKGESRSLSTAISITPQELSTTLFDRLRAASVVLGTGIPTLTTERDSVVYPRLTAVVVADAVAEAAAITPSDPTLDSITAVPRKLAALVQTSNEALDDSDPSLATVVNDHLLKVLALKLDQQLLEGSGAAPQVRGLRNIVGIQTLAAAANGQAPTFDNIADAIALLEAVNVPVERMRLVVHPRNVATLRKAKSSGGGEYLWSAAEPAGKAPASVFGVPVVTSPQLSTSETQGTSGAVGNSGYLFDTQSLVYVQRAPIAVELDRSRLFNSDQSEFRAVSRGDLISPTPSGVVRIAGLLA